MKNIDSEALEKRANEILSTLSDGEKCRLLYGDGVWKTNAILKKGIRAVEMHDGPLGLRTPLVSAESDSPEENEPATCFPSPSLLACSWDPSLEKEIGRAMAMEAITFHTDLLLAPGVNIKRNPLCGRNFEYLSEDPLLAGKLAAGFINGAQEEGVGCCLKHYALNNQEHNRFSYSAEVDERTIREFYLLPFEIAVKESSPWAVMASYNKINGTYACDNSYLLEDVLMKDWGFKGPVMSDWGATSDPVRSHDFGLSLEMPCSVKRERQLKKALRKGELRREKLEEAAKRMIQLSLLASGRREKTEGWMFADNHQLARKAAEKSMVLLKNEDGFLPFRNYHDCCIIGGFAEKLRYQGGGSSKVTPQALVNFLSAIPEDIDVPYAQGYPMGNGEEKSAQELLQEALDLASRRERVIFFLGVPEGVESEGYDRKNMSLPSDQIALYEAVRALTDNVVVVLLTGAPVELGPVMNAKAILLAYLPGEAGGEAIDHILRGYANPSGKLAESWPTSYEDVPSAPYFGKEEKIAPYKEAIFTGYRYYQSVPGSVSFPFGHGLSYSHFSYSSFQFDEEKKEVSFLLKNDSSIDGEEIAEVYLSYQGRDIPKPEKELAGFCKVSLVAGEEKKVQITLSPYAFRVWDSTEHAFKTLAGNYQIFVGTSISNMALGPISFRVKKDKNSYSPSEERLASISTYLTFRDTGKLVVDDSEFSALLSHPVTPDGAKATRPFDLNSTFKDIEETSFGKFIVSLIRKRYRGKENGEFKVAMEAPIRMAGNYVKPRVAACIVECCNGRYFHGLWRLIAGANGLRNR